MIFRFLFTGILFFFCGCSSSGQPNLRIALDPGWYPVDFGPQQPFVNGYVEDILLEMARYSGLEFQKMNANWDTLLEGLWQEKYDAVLTTLPRYSFNLAKYDFSEDCLALGPVLVLRQNDPHTALKEMRGEMVGIVTGDPAGLVLLAYPEVILREFASIPELFEAVVQGAVQGALLNQIPAATYVADLYSGQLKVASSPLNEEGIHLVTLKGRQEKLVQMFNRNLRAMQKKKKVEPLLKKWNLG